MYLNEYETHETLRKMELERIQSPRSRERWAAEWQRTTPPRRALAGWLGECLITCGERLRAWSAVEPPSYTRPWAGGRT